MAGTVGLVLVDELDGRADGVEVVQRAHERHAEGFDDADDLGARRDERADVDQRHPLVRDQLPEDLGALLVQRLANLPAVAEVETCQLDLLRCLDLPEHPVVEVTGKGETAKARCEGASHVAVGLGCAAPA
jgi:hypothetical protein